MKTPATASPFAPTDTLAPRHIGPSPDELALMLGMLDLGSLDELTAAAMPEAIQHPAPLTLPPARAEHELLEALAEIAAQNVVLRSCIGMGYSDCITPPVILRNILENPGWYTQYTPYQAEISQGRLELLFMFQTVIADLTGLPVANSSLLDEATAAAEAMAMSLRARPRRSQANTFFVAEHCHPQTLAVVQTRAEALGVTIQVGDHTTFNPQRDVHFGALIQLPTTSGAVWDPRAFIQRCHDIGALVTVACDLLSLTLITPPGALGADIAVGSSQRFGVPMGYGGPHAAYFATLDKHKRLTPGRIIGLSKDAQGRPALRLALQTREQHIRRDRATSNICTAQVLLAIVAAAYAIYHGPDGLRAIATRIRRMTLALQRGLAQAGHTLVSPAGPQTGLFDTLRVRISDTPDAIHQAARDAGYNLRAFPNGDLGVSLDETTTESDLIALLGVFGAPTTSASLQPLAAASDTPLPAGLARTSDFLTDPTFHRHHTETELLRYLFRLQSRDLSLAQSMIPLGSCTMKLNATSEMIPITWKAFAGMHPFAPVDQALGYRRLFDDLQAWLAAITGFDAASLQPNAGSQGEYAGLLVIRAWHRHNGHPERTVCLIPSSSHGTNPASATMAGMTVVGIKCDPDGNTDLSDLRDKAQRHADTLAGMMITYPSTYGVFEDGIVEICDIIHEYGGQVYLDGANMNAQVGLSQPGQYGADVCHLNLHKTFAIPHGGGGPGVGPICVKAHLAPFLPGHPLVQTGGSHAIGPVSAAPWGSAMVLPIAWVYIAAMGADGLRAASQTAVLSANYIARRLQPHYPVLFTNPEGFVAHECIISMHALKALAGVSVEDVAKRLMDYGFHAPTMSWPVHDTMMIEPTESESLAELDRFCDAMIAIRAEIQEIADQHLDHTDNLLVNAPHPAASVCANAWDHPYSRERAAYPDDRSRLAKFWPPVSRVDNAFGDRNLVCACPTVDELSAE